MKITLTLVAIGILVAAPVAFTSGRLQVVLLSAGLILFIVGVFAGRKSSQMPKPDP